MDILQLKLAEVKEELKEWLEAPNRKADDFEIRIFEIERMLNSEIISKAVFRQFDYLENWYKNNFVYEQINNIVGNSKQLSAAMGYNTLFLSSFLAKKYEKSPPYILFDELSYFLANCLSLKWYEKVKELIEIINNGLPNFLKGGLDFKPSFWFIIEIANKGFGIKMDYKKYNYPKDMGIYQAALDNWNTIDLNLLDSVVSKLCDFHLINATYGDGENTANIQFGDSAWFVYAFEILAWLSIREMIGLKNPEIFTHPLMNLALNKLPQHPIPFPENELFDRVIARLNES